MAGPAARAAPDMEGIHAATTVRVRGGKVLVTDGPFAETKEQLLGFILIDGKDGAATSLRGSRDQRVHLNPATLVTPTVRYPGAKSTNQHVVSSTYE